VRASRVLGLCSQKLAAAAPPVSTAILGVSAKGGMDAGRACSRADPSGLSYRGQHVRIPTLGVLSHRFATEVGRYSSSLNPSLIVTCQ
jgi:hypothetical protein